MLSLNEAVEKSKEMNKELGPILALWGVKAEDTIESEILGLHESATKLWVSLWKKDQKEINRRVASALIGVTILAYRLGVKDLEKEFLERIEEVIDGNMKAAEELKTKK